jgi:integration host factor subunit alpha
MVKADLVEIVCRTLGLSKKDSETAVEMVLGLIKETLDRGENVKISGFGTFVVREKNARRGHNPQTGEEIEIPARRSLSFKPSGALKKAVNGGDNSF